MPYPPKTRAEALKYRYRQWAGEPKGRPYQATYCAYEVPDGGRSCLFHQCGHRAKCGPQNLYCKVHAKIVENFS